MAKFEDSLAAILRNEGGYSNVVADSGQETYRGISRKNWPDWIGWKVVDANRDGANFPSNLESSALLQLNVAEFYRSNFWRFDELASQAVATKLMDMCVNMGFGQGIRLAQTALIRRFQLCPKADGTWGPITTSMVNRVDPESFLNELRAQSALFYATLVTTTPSNKPFLLGWLRRAVL